MEVVTSADLAQHLGVTPARVHQMVAEGVLPAPLRLGARTVVWPRIVIDLPAAERSGVVCLLPAADTPASLTHLEVISDVFVRYYQAPTGPVGLVSALNSWTAPQLSQAMMAGAARAAVSPLVVTWVAYSPANQLFWNLIVRARQIDRRDRALHQLGMADAEHTRLNLVEAHPVRHHDIVRILGRCPGLFAPRTHTRSVLHRLIEHQPTSPLEVEDPTVAPVVHDLLAHAQALHEATQDRWARREFTTIAVKAAHTLVARARTIDNTMGGVPVAHGAVPDALWLTRVVPVTFTATEKNLLHCYPPGDSDLEGRRPPVSLAPVHHLLSDFTQCSERLASVDATLAAAFHTAATTLALRIPAGAN